ncbi:MAG: hypothetical protein HUU15_14075 [Candidatus Brocadiae bacterium]|nr:hypothetical protein [Candidatus Brocadiia bacterium]
MRRLATILLFASLPCLAEEPKDAAARKEFEALEKRLSEAKTLRVVCKASAEGPRKDIHDTTLVLAAGGKARVEFNWKRADGMALVATYISDGARMWKEPDVDKAKKTPEGLSPALARAFARAGVLALSGVSATFQSGGAAPDPGAHAISEVTAGDADGKTTEIRYTVNAGKPDAMKVRLWLDAKTKTPVKRSMDVAGWVLVETYEAFEIGGKLDPALFQPGR